METGHPSTQAGNRAYCLHSTAHLYIHDDITIIIIIIIRRRRRRRRKCM